MVSSDAELREGHYMHVWDCDLSLMEPGHFFVDDEL